MIVHFVRTLYHRTGLHAALGWARAWVLGEVVPTDVTVCVLPTLALEIPGYDTLELRVPSLPTLALEIPPVDTLELRC